MTAADDLYAKEDWGRAISKYNEAKSIQSNDHITSRIKPIGDEMSSLQAEEIETAKLNELIEKAKGYDDSEDYIKALEVIPKHMI